LSACVMVIGFLITQKTKVGVKAKLLSTLKGKYSC